MSWILSADGKPNVSAREKIRPCCRLAKLGLFEAIPTMVPPISCRGEQDLARELVSVVAHRLRVTQWRPDGAGQSHLARLLAFSPLSFPRKRESSAPKPVTRPWIPAYEVVKESASSTVSGFFAAVVI